jgi:hypothetical protein
MSGVEGTSESSGFAVSWRSLSIAEAAITASLIAGFVVLAHRQSADALSTTALVLAILSFVAQLVLAFVQTYTGSLQIAETNKVNSDTKSALAAIAATNEALLSNQREQFSEVLQAALGVAVPEAFKDVSEANGPLAQDALCEIADALGDRLAVRIENAVRDMQEQPHQRSSGRTSMTVSRKPEKRPKVNDLYLRLGEYPSEARGKEVLQLLNGLTPQDAVTFSRVATLLSERARRGEGGRLSIAVQGRQRSSLSELQEIGLISVSAGSEHTSSDEIRKFWVELTELGMDVARLFLGQGGVPVWLTYA